MKSVLRELTLAFALVAAACHIAGCGGDDSVVYIEEDDAEMTRAVEQAQGTYRQFITALEAGHAQHTGFSVKKPFPTPDGGHEHIWLVDVRWDGSAFRGIVGNEPVDTDDVAFGDAATVGPNELSDWMYVDGTRIVGGYTLRVLHYRMPADQRRAFTEGTGLEVPPVDF